MELRDKYDLGRLENMWLSLVTETISGMVERGELCDCQDCVLDTAALALNSLPPSYWVLGSYDAFCPPEKFTEDPANWQIAERAVRKALSLVAKNPHH